MQSKRHEDFTSQSSFGRGRRSADLGPDTYLMMSPRSKRSWSPRRMEGSSYSERVLPDRSGSLERRRVLDDGIRRIRSRSPPYMEAKRGGPFYNDDWVADRDMPTPGRRSRYEFFDREDVDSPMRNEYNYGRGSSRTAIVDDKFEGRKLDSGRGEIVSRRSAVPGLYRSTRDMGPMSKPETRGDPSSASLNIGSGHLGKEKVPYPEVRGSYSYDKYAPTNQYDDGDNNMVHLRESPFSNMTPTKLYVGGDKNMVHSRESPYSNMTPTKLYDGGDKNMVHARESSYSKMTPRKQYDAGDKNMVHARESPYSNMTASRSKETLDASHLKDYSRTFPRNSRAVDHLGHRGGIPLPREHHPVNSTNIPEPLSHSSYEQRERRQQQQRQHLDPNLDINEDMVRYQREVYSPPRIDHPDSMHLQPQVRERAEYLYPSNDVYEKMNVRERADYYEREMIKPNVLDRVSQRTEASDYACRSMNNRSSLDHFSLTAANNIGLSRSPVEKRENPQYLDSASVHSRLGRKIPRENEVPYMGMEQDPEVERIERMRADYDYEYECEYKRDLGIGSQKERMRSPPGYLYETERSRLPHKMESHDLSPYDSSSRFLKRKYTIDDDDHRSPSRTIMNRLGTISRKQNQEFSDDEWTEQDSRSLSFTKRRDHHTHGFTRRRVENDYDEPDPMSERWYESHDPEEFIYGHHHQHQHHPMKSYNHEDTYAKGYRGRGGYHLSRRKKNMSIRSEHDKEDDMYEMVQYEPWGNSAKSEPREDSEEFKKLVHGYFLTFTKKLHEASGVRRRYMEQGRAGSLFCIVCGRSLSKEFMDTERLAMHAFMSRKVGRRAQHLGLHKAMCVMLGWNGAVPAETIRWFPENLSSTEALIQKEDLIIWPPVIVVHNISILNNDSNGQGPTTIEALGQFLRGKGLSGGKVKLGKPANCSIMLVKFLGTFSGLQEAEKIHQYFAKNKHGRKHLNQITSGKGKSKGSNDKGEGENENGDKESECVLFGYMGIAEDLDKVDFDTKKKCSIKSKKEIQDLADGPVKPE